MAKEFPSAEYFIQEGLKAQEGADSPLVSRFAKSLGLGSIKLAADLAGIGGELGSQDLAGKRQELLQQYQQGQSELGPAVGIGEKSVRAIGESIPAMGLAMLPGRVGSLFGQRAAAAGMGLTYGVTGAPDILERGRELGNSGGQQTVDVLTNAAIQGLVPMALPRGVESLAHAPLASKIQSAALLKGMLKSVPAGMKDEALEEVIQDRLDKVRSQFVTRDPEALPVMPNGDTEAGIQSGEDLILNAIAGSGMGGPAEAVGPTVNLGVNAGRGLWDLAKGMRTSRPVVPGPVNPLPVEQTGLPEQIQSMGQVAEEAGPLAASGPVVPEISLGGSGPVAIPAIQTMPEIQQPVSEQALGSPSEQPVQNQINATQESGDPGNLPAHGPTATPIVDTAASVPLGGGFEVGQVVQWSKGKKKGEQAQVVAVRPDGRLVLKLPNGKIQGKENGVTPGNLEVVNVRAQGGTGEREGAVPAAAQGAGPAMDQNAGGGGNIAQGGDPAIPRPGKNDAVKFALKRREEGATLQQIYEDLRKVYGLKFAEARRIANDVFSVEDAPKTPSRPEELLPGAGVQESLKPETPKSIEPPKTEQALGGPMVNATKFQMGDSVRGTGGLNRNFGKVIKTETTPVNGNYVSFVSPDGKVHRFPEMYLEKDENNAEIKSGPRVAAVVDQSQKAEELKQETGNEREGNNTFPVGVRAGGESAGAENQIPAGEPGTATLGAGDSARPAQIPSVSGPATGLKGSATSVVVAGRPNVPARYEVRELASLQASHLAAPSGSINANPTYPKDLQPRDYRQGGDEHQKVLSQAQNLNPSLVLSDAPEATSGPSIITNNGTVINGNSRVMTLQAANPQKALEYKKALLSKSSQFGIDPRAVIAMDRPVLVRVVDMDPASPEAKEFARTGNVSLTQAQSPARTAASLADLINEHALSSIQVDDDSTFSEAVTGPDGARFRQKLQSSLPSTLQSLYFDENGGLTDQGKALVRDMLLMKLLPVEVVEGLRETRRQLIRTLEGSIPQMLRLKDEAGAQEVNAALLEALKWLESRQGVRSEGDVEALVDASGKQIQADLFGRNEDAALTPAGRMLVSYVLREQGSPRRFKTGIVDAMKAIDQKRNGIFGESMPSEGEIIAKALEVPLAEGAWNTGGKKGSETNAARTEAPVSVGNVDVLPKNAVAEWKLKALAEAKEKLAEAQAQRAGVKNAKAEALARAKEKLLKGIAEMRKAGTMRSLAGPELEHFMGMMFDLAEAGVRTFQEAMATIREMAAEAAHDEALQEAIGHAWDAAVKHAPKELGLEPRAVEEVKNETPSTPAVEPVEAGMPSDAGATAAPDVAVKTSPAKTGPTLFEDGQRVNVNVPGYERQATVMGDMGGQVQVKEDNGKIHLLDRKILSAIPTNADVKPDVKSKSLQLAEKLLSSLQRDNGYYVEDGKRLPTKTSWQVMLKIAEEVYGGTIGKGDFSMQDVYEALQAAINMRAASMPRAEVQANDPAPAIKALEDLAARAPAQTVRSEEQQSHQQFSTPPAYAMVVNWVANIKPGEVYLEPNEGTGSLSAFGFAAGAKVIGNELSKRRSEIAGEIFPHLATLTENTDHLAAILATRKDIPAPSVVVMNPPFSATAGRTNKKDLLVGARHIRQALEVLRPGGRLVTIVGEGMSWGNLGGKVYSQWFNEMQKIADLKANILVDGKVYGKFGTNFGTRVLVFDKYLEGQKEKAWTPVISSVATIGELATLLEGIRNERQAPEPGIADYSATQQAPAEPAGGRTPSGSQTTIQRPVESGNSGSGSVASGSGLGTGRPKSGGRGRPARISDDTAVQTQNNNETDGGVRTVTGGSDESTGGRGPDSGDTGNRTGTSDARGLENVTDQQVEDEGDTYATYRPSVTIEGSKGHPAKLVESQAMASVQAPAVTYRLHLPQEVIGEGKLSDAQIEQVARAGDSHQQMLPDGSRRGYFIGDGTGVGKGRTIAGIILDNFQQGRKKAVWISKNPKLFDDAKRDWAGLGQNPDDVMMKKGKKEITGNGIAFMSYKALSHKGSKQKEAKTKEEGSHSKKVAELVKWLGADFDGVIAFDEAHSMGNAVEQRGKRGRKKASQTALVGLELQRALPKARVVYVSATGATEVSNLGYAERLGLWGEGTPFANMQDFIGKIGSSGIAAMEMVARDMKAMGLYLARSISFDGVGYDRLTHELTEDQTEIYNELAGAWQIVLNNLTKALEVTGGKKNKDQKSAAASAFWGAQQRFFNSVMTAMAMPSVIRSIESDLEKGHAPVIQLVNTNEAATKKALTAARANAAKKNKDLDEDEEDDLDSLDLTPRENLMGYLRDSFPTLQFTERMDADGNTSWVPAKDDAGNFIENQEAVKLRNDLLKKLASIRTPDAPMDQLLAIFGKDVAEVTGRTQRIVPKQQSDGSWKNTLESRSPEKAKAEAKEFQADKRKILIFSDAGGTGQSYHADKNAKNQRLRRHYVLQPGWRADAAMQGLGRSHRTNQAQPPDFLLVSTNLNAQKRFISSIARRLDQLGALTKGQRKAGSGGLFTAADNLESEYSEAALEAFTRALIDGEIQGITRQEYEEQTGLSLVNSKTGKTEVPTIKHFLNRMLSLKTDVQNVVFDAFAERLQKILAQAEADGTLDVGMETLKADKAEELESRVVNTDSHGAKTTYHKIKVSERFTPLSFDEAMKWATTLWDDKKVLFVANKRSGKVYIVVKDGGKTNKDGSISSMVRRYSILGNTRETLNSINDSKYTTLDEKQARELWSKELANAPEYKTREIHLVGGALLSVWNQLPDGYARVVRARLDDGRAILGREVSDSDIFDVLSRFEGNQHVDEATIWKKLQGGSTLYLRNGWKIEPKRVGNETRMELSGKINNEELTAWRGRLQNMGVITEYRNYNWRYFVPSDEVLQRLTKTSPVKSIITKDDAEPESVAAPERDLDSGNGNTGTSRTIEDQAKTRGRQVLNPAAKVTAEDTADGGSILTGPDKKARIVKVSDGVDELGSTESWNAIIDGRTHYGFPSKDAAEQWAGWEIGKRGNRLLTYDGQNTYHGPERDLGKEDMPESVDMARAKVPQFPKGNKSIEVLITYGKASLADLIEYQTAKAKRAKGDKKTDAERLSADLRSIDTVAMEAHMRAYPQHYLQAGESNLHPAFVYLERNEKPPAEPRIAVDGVKTDGTWRAPDLAQVLDRLKAGLKATMAKPPTFVVSKKPSETAESAGSYTFANAALRTKYHNDLDTVAHEVGHALGAEIDIFNRAADSDALRYELIRASQHGSPSADPKVRLHEGMAEVVRGWIADPVIGENRAPLTIGLLKSAMPETMDQLRAYGEDLRRYEGSSAVGKIAGAMSSTIDAAEKERKERGLFTIILDAVFSAVGSNKRKKYARSEVGWVPTGWGHGRADKLGGWWNALKERLGFELHDSDIPLINNWRLAMELGGKDFNTMQPSERIDYWLQFLKGSGGRIRSMMLDHGLAGWDMKPATFEDGSKMVVGELLKPITEAAQGNPGRVEELLDLAHAVGTARRAKEIEFRFLTKTEGRIWRAKEEMEKRIEGMNALSAAEEKQRHEAWAEGERKDTKRRLSHLTGAGAGVESSVDVTDAALREFDKMDKKERDAIDGYLDRYREWADWNLEYRVQSGMITQSVANKIREKNQKYIDWHRVFASMDSGIDGQVVGSTRTIHNPLVSLLVATEKTVTVGDKNRLMQMITEPLQLTQVLNNGMSLSEFGVRIDESDATEAYKHHQGTHEFQGRPAKVYRLRRTVLDENDMEVTRPEYWVFDAGTEASLEVMRGTASDHPWVQFMSAVNGLQRASIVLSPSFRIRTLFRDNTERLMVSQNPITGEGYRAVYEGALEDGTDLDQMFNLSGASLAGMTGRTRDQILRDVLGEVVKDGGRWGALAHGANWWQKAGEWSENVARKTEWASAFAAAKKAHPEWDNISSALYAVSSSRGLLDTAQKGRVIAKLNALTLFLNAGMKGIASNTRMIRRAWAEAKAGNTDEAMRLGGVIALRAGVMAATYGMIRLIVLGLNDDDKQKKLMAEPAHVRDFAVRIDVPFLPTVSLAKPYEFGWATSGAERLADALWAKGKGWDDEASRQMRDLRQGWLGGVMGTVIPVRPEDIGASAVPLIEVMANKDLFRKKTIVSRWEEGLNVDIRKGTEYASPLGKLVQAMSVDTVDARNADHLIQGYLGGFGRMGTSRDWRELLRTSTGTLGGTSSVGSSRDVSRALDDAAKLGRDKEVIPLKKVLKEIRLAREKGDDERVKRLEQTALKMAARARDRLEK